MEISIAEIGGKPEKGVKMKIQMKKGENECEKKRRRKLKGGKGKKEAISSRLLIYAFSSRDPPSFFDSHSPTPTFLPLLPILFNPHSRKNPR